jgi:hypothetical protein
MPKLKVLGPLTLVLMLAALLATSVRRSTADGSQLYAEPLPKPDANRILLQAETIDTGSRPSLDQVEIRSGLSLMGLDPVDHVYYLVQFRGAIREE